MSVVATLLPQVAQVQRLRAALRDRHELRECADWTAVLRVCDREPVRVAVLDLFATGEPNFEAIRQLKQQFPRLAIVAFVAMAPERGHDLFDAGRAGIDGLILVGEDDSPRPLLAIIEQSESRSLTGLLRRGLDGLDSAVVDAVLLTVTRAQASLTPTQLARLLALPRREMAARLAAAGLPAPQRLLTWGRLIVAAHMLEDEHRTADRVAAALGFTSGSAFRNTCQRYLYATPGEIRARGGASYVLGALLRQVHAHAANTREPHRRSPARAPGLAI